MFGRGRILIGALLVILALAASFVKFFSTLIVIGLGLLILLIIIRLLADLYWYGKKKDEW
jgi:uncharacterized membrane protein